MAKKLTGFCQLMDTFKVSSQVDGNMLIEINYREGFTPGVLDRMGIAEEIAELLYEEVGNTRRAKGWKLKKA